MTGGRGRGRGSWGDGGGRGRGEGGRGEGGRGEGGRGEGGRGRGGSARGGGEGGLRLKRRLSYRAVHPLCDGPDTWDSENADVSERCFPDALPSPSQRVDSARLMVACCVCAGRGGRSNQ
jgi:hypothetical protein